MDVVNERCAGLDVHKRTVVACVRIRGLGGGRLREKATRTFGTTVAGLEALRDRLGGYGVTRVAMESTGVYWRPVYTVLEPDFEAMQAPPPKAAYLLQRLRQTALGACAAERFYPDFRWSRYHMQ